MTVTSTDVANRALELIGDQITVTGVNPTFDGSPAGNALGVLYTPTVNLLLRQLNPAFARRYVVLTPSLNAPSPDWQFTYVYPSDAAKVRQLMPTTPTANDPTPVRWATVLDGTYPTNSRIIQSNADNARAVYTVLYQPGQSAIEDVWDWAFAEAVARRLASPLAMALAGRPDFAKELLDEAERYEQLADLVDEV